MKDDCELNGLPENALGAATLRAIGRRGTTHRIEQGHAFLRALCLSGVPYAISSENAGESELKRNEHE